MLMVGMVRGRVELWRRVEVVGVTKEGNAGGRKFVKSRNFHCGESERAVVLMICISVTRDCCGLSDL